MIGFFAIKIVQNSKVLNELLDVRTEVRTTSRTCKNVGRSQVKQTGLTEGVPAGKDARDFLLIIIVVVANWASNFHSNYYLSIKYT